METYIYTGGGKYLGFSFLVSFLGSAAGVGEVGVGVDVACAGGGDCTGTFLTENSKKINKKRAITL